MQVSLIQMTSSDDPVANTATVIERMEAAGDADLILTPEVTNCVSMDRAQQHAVLSEEADDPTLAAIRKQAKAQGAFVLIGSLALKTGDPDGRFANRSFLIDPDGDIVARYDKIHMFDVDLGGRETYRESAGYRPGSTAVLAPVGAANLGLSICYDLRFPALFRQLAQRGADIIAVPSAFAVATGSAHWETLLRARAIETGAFILAPAQCGTHPTSGSKSPRTTFGHSLVVSPWGEVLADAGTTPCTLSINLNLELVFEARQRIPALAHDRDWTGPNAISRT